eukprot:jgi/Astpho2/9382/fgenesh1_pg.00145_%23_10_t
MPLRRRERASLVRLAVSLLAWQLWLGVADAQVPSSIAGFPVANVTLASKGPVPRHGANARYDAMGYFGAGPQKGPGKPTAPKGLIPLGIGGNGTAQPGGDNRDNVTCDRDGYIFVPQSYQSNKSAAFLLALHDAGGNSSQPLELLAAAANKSGIINGDMFQQIMAFTPGGVAATTSPGRPFVYLSAGTQDPLFKSEYIIKGIVPLLEGGFGLNVTVNSGPWNHTVPPSVAQAGMQWFQDCPSRAMAPSPMPSG